METFDYVRLAQVVPEQHLGDVGANLREHIELLEKVLDHRAQVVCFPELSLTGYTLGDLFHQQVLHDAVLEAIAELRKFASQHPGLFFVVGAPFLHQGTLYNTALVFGSGRLLAVVPKSFLPGYDEFKETIYFHGAPTRTRQIELLGDEVTFGAHVVFEAEEQPKLRVGVEICEDLWAVVPPSQWLALNGATLILNLSASNELVGKARYRRGLVKYHSERCNAIYAYTSAGGGESTMDILFSGQTMVYESGEKLGELSPFRRESALLVTDVDVGRIENLRVRNTVWGESVNHRNHTDFMRIKFTTEPIGRPGPELLRSYDRLPLVPDREDEFQTIYELQRHALARRLERAGAQRMVIGVSGGVDSTHALLVCTGAAELLGWEMKRVHALTMPAQGTSERTLRNVEELCSVAGVRLKRLDVTALVERHLALLEHDGTPDVVFENVQTRVRYQMLFDHANKVGGLVVGTGDLSELALGWMTYSGDHMSNYAVNAGLSKTLIQAMLHWYARRRPEYSEVLADILDTPISPELIPPTSGRITQRTEELIGPYELHDFFLYHLVVSRFPPRKVRYIAAQTFEMEDEEIARWLKVFVKRFFRNQFKRSASPDGIKIGPVSLSPRSQWRMPSDAEVTLWLEDLDN